MPSWKDQNTLLHRGLRGFGDFGRHFPGLGILTIMPSSAFPGTRHSFATHLAEAGASIHTIKALLGHKSINTTMIYMHLTHRSEQDSRALVEQLCGELPR